MRYYIPVAVFGLWGLYGLLTIPRWRDARYVRQPERRVMSVFRLLDDEAWTEEGRVLRRRYVRHAAIGMALAVAAIIVVASLEQAGI